MHKLCVVSENILTDNFKLEGAAAATTLIDGYTQVLALVLRADIIHVTRETLVT